MAEEGPPRLFNARRKGADQGTDPLKAGGKADSPSESLLGSVGASRGQRGGNQRAVCRREAVDAAASVCIGAGGRGTTLPIAHF